MKLGLIIAIVGAVVAIVGGTVLPLYDMVFLGKQAAMTDAGLGILVIALCAAVLPVIGWGFYFRKLKQAATISIFLSATALGVFTYVVTQAPQLLEKVYSLAFDANGKFQGYMEAGAGFWVVWGGLLLTLFAALKSFASKPKYSQDVRFLRVALMWKDTLLRELILAEGQNVTVGSDLRTMFPLPVDFEKLTVIRHKGGRQDQYWLGLTDKLEGKVTIDGKTEAPADFKKKHTTDAVGVQYVRIKPGDNGALRFGDNSLLFQFTRPAVANLGKSMTFDTAMASSFTFSAALQIAFVLGIAIFPSAQKITRAKSADELRRFIKIDVKREMKKEERIKEEEQLEARKDKTEEIKPEEQQPEEDLALKEEVDDTPTMEQTRDKAGDPLKKETADNRPDEEFKKMKEGDIGKNAKRDSNLAKARKKGVIAVLDSKMNRNTSLSKLLGKDRNRSAKNVIWGEGDGNFALDDGSSDFNYVGNSSGSGDFGGGGGIGGAGGFGGGGGGFGGGGAFGLGGMGGMGGGLPGGIGGADADRKGKMALASLKDRDRRRAARVKLGGEAMGQFCKKNDVQRKVQGRSAAIRACYEMVLQVKPDLAGKVTVQWMIDLTGRVQGVQVVGNTTSDKRLEECIKKIIGKIHFAPPQGGMCIIRWPFVFSPG